MYYRVILWIMALTVFTVGGRAAADETLTFKFQEDVDHGQGVYKDCNDVTINKPGTVPIAELSPYIYINTDYATSREWYNTLIRFDHLANYLPEQGLSLEVVEAYLTLTFYNDGSYQPAVEAEVNTHPVLKSWNGTFTDWNNADENVAWEQPGAQGSSDRGEPHTSVGMGERDPFTDPYKGGEKFDFALPPEVVQSWLADPNDNKGIIMVIKPSTGPSVQFYSSDYEDDLSYRPMLTIIARELIPPCEPIPADLNNDCYVNHIDLWMMSAQWLECTGGSADIYDDDGDGCVNMLDYAFFAGLWLVCSDPTNDRCTWPPVVKCPPIPGDLNEDCYVNLIDLWMMTGQWLQCTGGSADIYDDGGDGCVNLLDYARLASSWLQCSDYQNSRCTWGK
ncbi:MAG: hypothetical protein AMJ79_07855 [Phycisphaerae bacterium SM23_30]|nr:MAG: hypothetical protein AMJ79_07855 [Phycisphaerae bacterium SM23_30]